MAEFNENVEYCDAEFIEGFEDSEGGRNGLIGIGIALGVAAIGAGAAVVASKKGVFKEFKEKRAVKKLEKLEKKFEKQYTLVEEIKAKKEKTEEEE